jgi:hypothetical protein
MVLFSSQRLIRSGIGIQRRAGFNAVRACANSELIAILFIDVTAMEGIRER